MGALAGMYAEPAWAITRGNREMRNVKKIADLLDRDDRRRLQWQSLAEKTIQGGEECSETGGKREKREKKRRKEERKRTEEGKPKTSRS